MASEEEKEKDKAEEDASSPVASTSQEAPEDATPPILQDTSQEAPEDANPPILQNTEGCANWCRHCFCFSCVQEWARRDNVCPNCQQPIRHRFPRLGPHSHQKQDITPGGRPRGCSAARRRRHSSGSQHCSYSSRAHEGGRSRSQSWHQDGHSRAEHGWGYNSPRSRRWQQSRSRDSGGSESRALRQERDVPVFSQQEGGDTFRDRRTTRRQSWQRARAGRERSQRHHGRLWWWDSNEEHSCNWGRQWRRSRRRGHGRNMGTAAHGSSARRRCRRSRDRDPWPQQDTWDFWWRSLSTGGRARTRWEWQRRRNWERGRGPQPQQDIWDYSRRSRSRRSSRSSRGRARPWQERQRRRDWGQGQAPRSRWGVSAYSRRERRRRGGRHPSREGRAERRRSQRRTW